MVICSIFKEKIDQKKYIELTSLYFWEVEAVKGNLNIQCTCCQCLNLLRKNVFMRYTSVIKKKKQKNFRLKLKMLEGKIKEWTDCLEHEETQLNHSQ